MDCVKRRLQFDLDKKSKRLHLLMGLKKILLDIDKAIQIIRSTEEEAQVVPNLMSGFAIDEMQAEYIAEIKLRHLNKEYIMKRLEDIDGLKQDIANIQYTLSSNLEIKKIIIHELGEIAKKYGAPRRTNIVAADEVEEIAEDSFIEDYPVRLFLTKQTYFKKISLASLRASNEHKFKEDDALLCECECSNKAEILFFSDRANVYKLRAYELADCKASALGEYLPNRLELEEEESIIFMAATDDYAGTMLFAFENGKMAKVPLESYQTKTNRKKLANAYYANSRLVDIRFLPADTELVAFSSINKVLVFNTAKIALKTTRSTQGVQVLNSKKGSTLSCVKTLNEVVFKDFDYYRTKNIPATGTYLQETDSATEQLKLF